MKRLVRCCRPKHKYRHQQKNNFIIIPYIVMQGEHMFVILAFLFLGRITCTTPTKNKYLRLIVDVTDTM